MHAPSSYKQWEASVTSAGLLVEGKPETVPEVMTKERTSSYVDKHKQGGPVNLNESRITKTAAPFFLQVGFTRSAVPAQGS